MDVELVTEETSEDENYGLDDYSEDYLNYEGERCGICMDVVIDRGVLDCCQHWFCFACIDNWATITSLCPLCQNEFQLITCVPVYDTVGGNKTDDETNRRDDDWFIEEKANTLSFPSYYIDENAVVCLDGDACKIRSGSVAIEEDSDIDISIACDSCDKWYHAFCVGFDPEGTCDSSWLCPRCTAVKGTERERVSVLSKNYHNDLEIVSDDYPVEASFSGRVSVADDGETAILISLVEGNQDSRESIVACSKNTESTLSSSTLNMPNSEALQCFRNSLDLDSCQQETGFVLPRDNSCTSSHSQSHAELKIDADDAVKTVPKHLNSKMIDTVNLKDNNRAEDHEVGSLEAKKRSEDLLPGIYDKSEQRNYSSTFIEKMATNEMEAFTIKSLLPDEEEKIDGTTGAKRKLEDSRNADDGEGKANNDTKFSRKKIKAERDSQPTSLTDQSDLSSVDDSKTNSSRSNVRSSTYKCKSEKEIGTSDIMDIIQEKDRRSVKQLKHQSSSDRGPEERESVAGLRLKKIMRRAGDNKDSLELVQELRKKIREAVRNKSSKELGQEHFDPQLLNAFRAALAGTGAENRKPTVDVKAKRSLLQKGKVRENLTKKIYGSGGKRQRAWTRECEVEFWKHRCLKTSKSEKIQTLKSVLDALRENSDCADKLGDEQGTKGSILSRLYLADNSVFPRKNNIQPVSALTAVSTPEQKRHDNSAEKASPVQLNNQSDGNPQKHNIVLLAESKETKKITKVVNSETASSDAQRKQYAKGALKKHSEDTASKPDAIKGDKRKWALKLLARQTAVSGKNMQEDNTFLRGNYALLAQLPKDMQPVLAPSRHNKIPISVRQAQLYRLSEHFLKKANVPVVSRTAETELAVADAVNIEKQIADRSNSKPVYLNLCSQELSRRSDDVNFNRAKDSNACSSSECLSVGPSEETNNSSSGWAVDEALRKVGLISDSPPNSPNHPTEDINNRVGSPEDSDEEGPDNVIEVVSHPDLDIYGDFEYSLEDDDFIGAGALSISKLEPEVPKMKLLFSSLKSEKSNGILDPLDSEVHRDVEASAGPLDLVEPQNKTSTGGPTVDCGIDAGVIPNSTDHNGEEPSLAECEELYGPDTELLIEKYPYPETVFGKTVRNELGAGNEGYRSNHTFKDNLESSTDESKQLPSDSEKKENLVKRENTSKHDDGKQSDCRSMVMKKVEAYIKEHIRPLCKSGVITVEQYRWAVGKTTEKVMKYHSKERNANFLIKEGEKVKKLAEQYVEAAQKTKS